MKLFRQTAAILASAMLLLTSCGGNSQGGSQSDGGTTAKGRYIETDYTPTDMDFNTIQSFHAHKDGSVDLFGFQLNEENYQYENLTHMKADKDGKWSKVDSSWYQKMVELLKIDGLNTMPTTIQADKDGNIYYLLTVQRPDEGAESEGAEEIVSIGTSVNIECHLVKIAKDGTVGEILIPELSTLTNDYGGVSGMELTDNGDILISYFGDNVVRILYAPDGTQKGSFEGNYRSDVALLPDALVQPATTDTELFLYKFEKAKPFVSPPPPSVDEGGNMMSSPLSEDEGLTADEKIPVESLSESLITGSSEGAVYTIRRTGVTRNLPGGSITETVMDGAGYSFGFPSSSMRQFQAVENGDFYLLINTTDGQKLYQYRYDKNAKAVPQTEIVLFSMRDSYTVRQAIAQFQRLYPEARINHQIGISDDANRTVDDVIRSLNTELLAGKGPDVLILDELPVDSLVKKGMLADLTGKVSTDGLFPGVAKAFEKDGKLLAVAGKFKLPLLSARPEDIAGVNTLEDFVKKIEAGESPYSMEEMNKRYADGKSNDRVPYTSFESTNEMMEQLYIASADSIVVDNKIDEAALRKYLESLNRIKEKLSANWIDDYMGGGGSVVSMSSATAIGSGSFYSMSPSQMEYLQANILATTSSYTSMACLMPGFFKNRYHYNNQTGKVESMPGKMGEGDFAPMPGLTVKNRFVPTAIAGVNVSSKNQDLAAKFISTILMPEVQKTEFDDGFPINRDAFNEILDKNLKDHKTAILAGDLTAYCDTLDTPVIEDSLLTEVMQSEAVSYLKGEKSLDEAIGEILSKTKTYFAERS